MTWVDRLLLPGAGVESQTASCSLGSDPLLECSPASVVTLEIDFCSRLVNRGEKTALNDTAWIECLWHLPVGFPPSSSQSFQKTPSSCFLLLCSHPTMKSQECCLAFATVGGTQSVSKWPHCSPLIHPLNPLLCWWKLHSITCTSVTVSLGTSGDVVGLLTSREIFFFSTDYTSWFFWEEKVEIFMSK